MSLNFKIKNPKSIADPKLVFGLSPQGQVFIREPEISAASGGTAVVSKPTGMHWVTPTLVSPYIVKTPGFGDYLVPASSHDDAVIAIANSSLGYGHSGVDVYIAFPWPPVFALVLQGTIKSDTNIKWCADPSNLLAHGIDGGGPYIDGDPKYQSMNAGYNDYGEDLGITNNTVIRTDGWGALPGVENPFPGSGNSAFGYCPPSGSQEWPNHNWTKSLQEESEFSGNFLIAESSRDTNVTVPSYIANHNTCIVTPAAVLTTAHIAYTYGVPPNKSRLQHRYLPALGAMLFYCEVDVEEDMTDEWEEQLNTPSGSSTNPCPWEYHSSSSRKYIKFGPAILRILRDWNLLYGE